MITIRLSAYATIELGEISDILLQDLMSKFKLNNPEYAKQRNMGYQAINEPEHYLTYTIEHGLIRFWRGCSKRLRAIIEDHGYQVRYIDQRKSFDPVGLDFGKLRPFPEQMTAAKDMIKYQQGMVRGETGCGKTEIGLTAIILANQPSLIVVWNKDLLAQWQDRIIKYDILSKKDIGIIQGAKNKYGLITIAMIQSLYKRTEEWKGKFGTLLLDEAQRAPARTFSDGIIPFPAKYRWGLSADEGRRDGKEFLGYEVFGYQEWNDKPKKNKYSPLHIVEGRGQSLEPLIRIVGTGYEDEEYEQERIYTQLISRLVKDRERNDLIAYHLKKELQSGKQVILFTERVETAIWWSDLVSSWGFKAGPLIGGTKHADQTRSMIKQLQSGKARFTSTTSYGDVGLDVPSFDCGFGTCPTASNIKRMHQQVGRIVRPCEGKGEPIFYYFWDRYVEGLSRHKKNIEKKWNKIEVV